MSKLKFKISEYEKYNTKRVSVFYAYFKFHENREVLDVTNTNYGYKKAVVKLSPQKFDIMSCFEVEVNEYLEKNNLPKVTIVYGNQVYCKVKKDLPTNKINVIKLKGVFINDENKSFPQIWVEEN